MANITSLKPKASEDRPDIGLSEEYRLEASEHLSEILASTYRLMIKTQVYHWNIVGPAFKSIHEMTEQQYNALFAAADIIAERVRALGHLAPLEFAEMKKFAPTGSSVDNRSAKAMVEDLIVDHEAAVREKRKFAKKAGEAGDMVTEDMITERLTFHETSLWMLRATIAE